MKPRKNLKTLAAAAVIALSATALSACGGDTADDMPANASTQEFCDTIAEIDDLTNEGSVEEQLDAVKKQAEAMKEVGTPEDMTEEMRASWADFLDTMGSLDKADVAKIEAGDLEALGLEEKDFDTLGTYLSETCASEGSTTTEEPETDSATGAPSDDATDLPSELPTELPSDLPTELPSDLPTELPSDMPTSLEELEESAGITLDEAQEMLEEQGN